MPLPPIDEDGGEEYDAGDIIDCATGPSSSGEGADDGSGSVQPSASASSPSGSGETSLTPDASSADTLPTAVRTVQRQLSAYLTGPHDHEEHRVGRTRADERAARRAAAEEAAQAQEMGYQNHGMEEVKMKEGETTAVDEEEAAERAAVRGCVAPGTGLGLLASREVKSFESTAVTTAVLDETLRVLFKEDVFDESNLNLPTCLAHEAEPEPSSYSEACKSRHASVWKEAMFVEFRGLVEAGTFTFRQDIDPLNVIDGKWVFMWKTDSNGYITRAKARLVARGFRQVEGVDYFETFAPTPTAATIRLAITYACQKDVGLLHFDVDQAFVRSKLDEEVWFRLPDGCGDLTGRVVRLNMSLYGLKQASRQWNKTLTARLQEMKFEQCPVDPCLMRLIIDGEIVALVVMYVDDIMFCGCKKIGVLRCIEISF